MNRPMNNGILSWQKHDIEKVCGFAGKKFTGVSMGFSFLLGALLFMAFYGSLWPFAWQGNEWIDMFFHGGPKNRSYIPYYTIFLTCWSLAILFIKWRKLVLQRRALSVLILPKDPNFILTPITAREILDNIYHVADFPSKFLLLDRVTRSLSNLKNLGNVSDVAEGLTSQAENDEAYLNSTYTILKGFVWAIPVLGFIGTVLGLAQSVGGFGDVVAQGASVEVLKSSLGGVTAGLGTAFETTLIALVAALIVQLLMSLIQGQEEHFLDECSDYCHRNIISKLKTVNLRENPEIGAF